MLAEWLEWGSLVLIGFLAGGINAVAGGGSLLVFPALLATGLPPLVANVTNSVAQGPGFVGASLSQRHDLHGQRRRTVLTSLVALVGSVIGCVLLLTLPGSVFDAVVPMLIGLSAVLMAFQDTIRGWLGNREPGSADRTMVLLSGIFLASIYGAYFGGARSVILIALLVVAVNDHLRRLNALKNGLSLVGSIVTFAVYAAVAPVDWSAVLALVPTTLLGGMVGGKLARRLPATLLRYVVVVIAAGVAVYMAVT